MIISFGHVKIIKCFSHFKSFLSVIKGSVEYEVNEMSAYEIYITRHSVNTINELKSYKYLEDKTGKILNQPEDKNNHSVDAVRYWFKTNVITPTRVIRRVKLG